MLEATAGTTCRSVVDVETGDPSTLRRDTALATDAILPVAASQLLTGRTGPTEVVESLTRCTPGLTYNFFGLRVRFHSALERDAQAATQ